MTEQETRIVTMTVEAIKATTPQEDGTIRYQISADIPEISKFPMPLFVTTAPAPVPGQTLTASLTKGKLKTGKTGQYDNEFYWDVAAWDVGGAAASPQPDRSQPAGGATNAAIRRAFVDPTNDIDRRRAEDAIAFRRRDALNAAVDFLKTAGASSPIQALEFADTFFAWLNQHPEPNTQDPPAAPEQPAQQRDATAGTKPQGKIVTLPNQITVPDMMDSSEFVAAVTRVEWSREQVRAFLGDKSATQFTEEDNSDQDYRPAWDACVDAWQNAQEPVEGLSW
tara:strand:- start:863 stop:1705 length:843 start_codon:yes stop_codon:yes gene_type:complete